MFRFQKDYLIIAFVFLLASLVLWGWFWFKSPEKLQYVYQNWDGPNYVIIARSFYDPKFGLPTFYLGEKVYIYLILATAIFKLFWERRFFLAGPNPDFAGDLRLQRHLYELEFIPLTANTGQHTPEV